MRLWLNGRALRCQRRGCEFESRLPLTLKGESIKKEMANIMSKSIMAKPEQLYIPSVWDFALSVVLSSSKTSTVDS